MIITKNNIIKDNLNQSFEKNNIDLGHISINNDNSCNTQMKEKFYNERFTIYKSIQKSKDNIIRITTYKKVRKKKNNETNSSSDNKSNDKIIEKNNNNTNNNIPSSNDLLQYDIFNQSKNYFNLNVHKGIKLFKSVKTKELTNFLLKEYSDTFSDKIPRSKKLYEESNINTENKTNNKTFFNNEEDIKGAIKDDIIIAIKEENNDNVQYVGKNEIDLEDYVYNPFRNCYAKIRKF